MFIIYFPYNFPDKLSLQKGVFILYGLHIGCTALAFFIASIFFSNKHKFRRATAMASLYYIVNLLTVIVLLPFEVILGKVMALNDFTVITESFSLRSIFVAWLKVIIL